MSATITQTVSSVQKLELTTAYGPVYRDVLTAPPRDATPEEIPIIDITDLDGDAQARTRLSGEIKKAAMANGFFYIKNHGIDDSVIEKAKRASLDFFAQPKEAKMAVSKAKSKYYNGWSGVASSQASRTESRDMKEGFSWRYAPQYDPETKDPALVPEAVRPFIRGEEFVWEGTTHLGPAFKADLISYWQSCLTLARRLVRIFAICLDLPESHFDSITTYPGADGVLNYYPAMTSAQAAAPPTKDVGLGSHTDLQCFTLLWQDMVGGLQVLSPEGQWLKAAPKEGTFVVNIGDFLMRMSNDKFKSTVHRVYNRATVDRISMPFFFGFNFNETCSVLDTCIDEHNPPRYEPITCGEWCQLRFKANDRPQPA